MGWRGHMQSFIGSCPPRDAGSWADGALLAHLTSSRAPLVLPLVSSLLQSGPLRNTEVGPVAGTLGAAGLVTILSICLTIYGIATFKEGAPSTAPSLTLTGRTKEADKLQVHHHHLLWEEQ